MTDHTWEKINKYISHLSNSFYLLLLLCHFGCGKWRRASLVASRSIRCLGSNYLLNPADESSVHCRDTWCQCVCRCTHAQTQRCVEHDAHQVKPVVLNVLGRVERVAAPLKGLVGRLSDQPVVRLGVGGVHDGDVALHVHKHLDVNIILHIMTGGAGCVPRALLSERFDAFSHYRK